MFSVCGYVYAGAQTNNYSAWNDVTDGKILAGRCVERWPFVYLTRSVSCDTHSHTAYPLPTIPLSPCSSFPIQSTAHPQTESNKLRIEEANKRATKLLK